jgi:hypothetical protein
MLRLAVPSCALFALCLSGCGPMLSPMTPRLEEKEQKEIDEAWARAFTPAEKLDRRTLLDAMLVYRAYEIGVDKLSFRSEKHFPRGLVVMEVAYDRARPTADEFSVKVFDLDGTLLRHERFNRKDVEDASRELVETLPEPKAGEDPELTRKREAQKARLETLRNSIDGPKHEEQEKKAAAPGA